MRAHVFADCRIAMQWQRPLHHFPQGLLLCWVPRTMQLVAVPAGLTMIKYMDCRSLFSFCWCVGVIFGAILSHVKLLDVQSDVIVTCGLRDPAPTLPLCARGRAGSLCIISQGTLALSASFVTKDEDLRCASSLACENWPSLAMTYYNARGRI